MVQLLRWVVAGQMIIGFKDLPLPLMHSIELKLRMENRCDTLYYPRSPTAHIAVVRVTVLPDAPRCLAGSHPPIT